MCPEPWGRLQGATISTTERVAVSATRRLRRCTAAAVALVGDASGSVDAITGEGLRLGFEQSLALAEAVTNGGPAGVCRGAPPIGAAAAFMAALMLSMDRSAWLRRHALRALCGEPPESSPHNSRCTSGEANTTIYPARHASLGAPHSNGMKADMIQRGLLFLLVCNLPLAAAESTVELDPARTPIRFTVDSVLHTVHGSFKLKRGSVKFDSASGKAWERLRST